jgi:polyisoprenoid-binding protein YceI
MRERFELDPAHTLIGFSVKHLAITTIRGSFGKFEGAFEGDRQTLQEPHGELKIDAASITTGEGERDEHLRSADFFETEKYPHIIYRLTGVEWNGDAANYFISGDLTIKQTTRPLTLIVVVHGELNHGKKLGTKIVSISATGELDRMDYGLTWDGLAETVPLVGRQIKINIDTELLATPFEADVAARA